MIKECCNDNNLEYGRAHSCSPYEIWFCKECDKEYDIELIRDFENKEER